MVEANYVRLTKDRRRVPRGGRRDDDLGGFYPLIFLIDDNVARREAGALLLLHARFAVAPFPTAQAALAVLSSLAPDAIVAAPAELDAVTARVPTRRGTRIPVVPLHARTDVLMNALRTAFRSTAER